jgi:ABC-type thiamine transport system ATPase subunit
MPSFVIEAAGSGAFQAPALRLDRINSRDLLAAAREVYYTFLANAATPLDPLGVVLSGGQGRPFRGRVVFQAPVLLPDEVFVALDLLRSRGPRTGRTRSLRPPSP